MRGFSIVRRPEVPGQEGNSQSQEVIRNTNVGTRPIIVTALHPPVSAPVAILFGACVASELNVVAIETKPSPGDLGLMQNHIPAQGIAELPHPLRQS